MYSVILAAMLTGGAQQAESWHWRSAGCVGSCYGSCVGSCYGCSGCVGSSCSGCSGCVGSCYGSSCHGFGHGHGHGRLFNGCHGGLFSRWHGSNYSSGYGYTVGYTYWASGCYGTSCFGGCYGTAGIGCYGWTGGYAASTVPSPAFTDAEYYPGGAVAPAQPNPLPTDKAPKAPEAPKGDSPKLDLPKVPDAPKGLDLPKIGAETNSISASSAVVVVMIPAEAKLWVDAVSCPLTGTMRSFNTPALTPGAQYAYTLMAEMPDGSRQERRVTMAAGGVVEVDFRGMGTNTAQR